MVLRTLSFFILISCFSLSVAFIVGGCIGPKSVLERLLSVEQKIELRRLVHTQFDGSNSAQVLPMVNQAYQSKYHECSIYAQLLPKNVYKSLLHSVWRASEAGASKDDLKRLVEDYVDRALIAGVIPEPSRPQLKIAIPNPLSGHYYRNVVANHPPSLVHNAKPTFPLIELYNHV